ncbi:hypothetical protein JOD54_001116 [Actinokineospora baliensis]|uniref:hypothetical protein n=1 Tax=Actinokineospora baliensis TaxID=547056 RepID=UPI00195D6787|nr:hypothetical protein [Actinokineospora baliensis]MBM7770912.1 hypothetical protein [Actinokineospora baliensis]
MSRFIVKFAPETDAYALWSLVVDGPVAVGSRAEVTRDRIELYGPSDRLDAAFAAADARGTSSIHGVGRWDDPVVVAATGTCCGELQRADLAEFCAHMLAQNHDRAAALLTLDEDDV